jgi:hypothetical protein
MQTNLRQTILMVEEHPVQVVVEAELDTVQVLAHLVRVADRELS